MNPCQSLSCFQFNLWDCKYCLNALSDSNKSKGVLKSHLISLLFIFLQFEPSNNFSFAKILWEITSNNLHILTLVHAANLAVIAAHKFLLFILLHIDVPSPQMKFRCWSHARTNSVTAGTMEEVFYGDQLRKCEFLESKLWRRQNRLSTFYSQLVLLCFSQQQV